MNGISNNGLITKQNGQALLVSNSNETISTIEEMLATTGILTLLAKNEEQAFSYLEKQQVSYVLIESGLSEAPCRKFIRDLKIIIADKIIPIIILAVSEDEEQLFYCMSAGCDDILFKPFTALALNTRISALEKMRELKQLYKSSINEQVVARRILLNSIDERSIKFNEIELLSRSKAIFSGDLFITARHPDGSVNVLLGDFTGHGLPSAIGAFPVADVFSAMTEKGFEPGYILENINNKLHTLLPTSMFMACTIINIAHDLKQVKIWNGGMPDVYIRSIETGKIIHKVPSSDVPLGITNTVSNQYKLIIIELTPGDQLILFSDGLTESLNKDDDMFGESRLEACIRKNNKAQSVFTKLVNTFDEFRGGVEAMDDITLVCIPCTDKLMYENNIDISKKMHIACSQDNRWHWYIELGGSSLREINPVQNVIEQIHKICGASPSTEKLSSIMSTLYRNAIKQQASEDNSAVTSSHASRKRCDEDTDIFIRIGIKKIYHNGIPALLIHMEDSGKEISQDALLSSLHRVTGNNTESHADDYPLVYELNKLSRNKNSGNRLEAIIFEHEQQVNHYG